MKNFGKNVRLFGLFYEFVSVLFESFFAFYAAEVVYFAFVPHIEFGCFFVQVYSADRVSEHGSHSFSCLVIVYKIVVAVLAVCFVDRWIYMKDTTYEESFIIILWM